MAYKKDNTKLQNERHQLLIQELLKDEDNKYCVDCDAKGPRWASWNIGVFLCIRCAGIHRNLGVHISKVKSVNLDIWTTAQLAIMRNMGNSRARAIYEAQLPDGFKRPQTDSALEAFIRSKYEKKRYMAPEYIPTEPDVEGLMKEIERLEQGQKRRPNTNMVNLGTMPTNPNVTHAKTKDQIMDKSKKIQDVDLLGLNSPSKDLITKPATENLFDSFNENSTFTNQLKSPFVQSSVTKPNESSFSADLFDLDLSNNKTVSNQNESTTQPVNDLFTTTTQAPESSSRKSRDSIMALYQQTPNQFNQFGSTAYPTSFGTVPNYFASNTAVSANSNFNSRGDQGFQTFVTLSNPSTTSNYTFSNFGFTGSAPNNAHAPTFCQKPNVSNWPQSECLTMDLSNTHSTSSNPFFNQSFANLNAPNNTHTTRSNQPWNMNNYSGLTDVFNSSPSSKVNKVDNQAYLTQIQGQLASLQVNGSSKPFS